MSENFCRAHIFTEQNLIWFKSSLAPIFAVVVIPSFPFAVTTVSIRFAVFLAFSAPYTSIQQYLLLATFITIFRC